MSSTKAGKRKEVLWRRQRGRCAYCMCFMLHMSFWKEGPLKPNYPKGDPRRRPPKKLATLEHVHSRLHPERGNGAYNKNVLVCYECNHQRGREEYQSLSIEEQRERSSHKGP